MSKTLYAPRSVADARADVGEGPLWIDSAAGALLWVDHTGRCVHRYDPMEETDDVTYVHPTQQVASIRSKVDGGYILALDLSLHLFDGSALDPTPLLTVERDVPSLLNETVVDPNGRMWIGVYESSYAAGQGVVLRENGDGSTTTVLRGLTLPNGMGFSPDGRELYVVDSFSFKVLALPFDPSTGEVGEPRTIWSDETRGYPDGLAVDAQGRLWIAFWGGSAVRCIEPSGELVREIHFPVTQVSSCAFGGADRDDLYVTSARYHLSDEALDAQPHAGALFVVHTDTTGAPSFKYAAL